MRDARPAKAFSRWEWMVAFRYLRSRRKEGGVALISGIAFSAIALGIAVLIIVMSVMNGFRAELLSSILSFNDHAYVQGTPTYEGNYQAAAQRLKAAPGVTSVTPMVEAQAIIQGGGVTRGVNVRGISREDLAKSDVGKAIVQGSLDGFGEGESGGDLIVLGARLAADLGVKQGDFVSMISPSGSSTAFGVTPAFKEYLVAGVFSVEMSTFDQLFVYMPLEQAKLFFGLGGDVSVIKVNVEDPDHILNYMGGISRAAGAGAVTRSWQDDNASYWGALQVERNMMRMIMMLIIGIAALNIISALVMLVKNKERDIAIMRTVGASQGAIMRIFLLSGAALGVVAAPIGVAMGVLFCLNIKHIQGFVDRVTNTQVFNPDIYFLSSLPAKLDWTEVALVFLWTLGCSLVVTLYPSWRASKIDPVEALRYE